MVEGMESGKKKPEIVDIRDSRMGVASGTNVLVDKILSGTFEQRGIWDVWLNPKKKLTTSRGRKVMPKREEPEQFDIKKMMNKIRDNHLGAEEGTHDKVDGILEKAAEQKKAREEAGHYE